MKKVNPKSNQKRKKNTKAQMKKATRQASGSTKRLHGNSTRPGEE